MRDEEFGSIADQEVYEAVCSGETINIYPDDKPYPSALIFGVTTAQRPLHIVCAYDKDDDYAVVITVYQPDPDQWEEYRRRKKK